MAENNIAVPSYKIELDGSDISPEMRASVEGVEFEEEINSASMFVIKLSAIDFDTMAWKYLDLKTIQLGNEIKLYFGFEKLELMMVGEITSLEPSFSNNFTYIEIRGYDRLHKLRFGQNIKTFKDVKDSDIAATISGDWGLQSDVEDSTTVHPYIYQNNQSDLEFLLERAKRIRYELFVKDKKLYFKKPGEKDSPVLILEYKVDIEEFSAKLSAQYEGSKIMVQGWDFMKKESITAIAQTGDEVAKMSAKETGVEMTKTAFKESTSAIVDELIVDKSDAETLAKARFNTQIVESVIGDGKCMGNPLLRAGKTIEIKGIDRFSGIYYVKSTAHSINNQGYFTSFKVRRVGI